MATAEDFVEGSVENSTIIVKLKMGPSNDGEEHIVFNATANRLRLCYSELLIAIR